MKQFKKIAAFVTALTVVFSMSATTIFATETETGEEPAAAVAAATSSDITFTDAAGTPVDHLSFDLQHNLDNTYDLQSQTLTVSYSGNDVLTNVQLQVAPAYADKFTVSASSGNTLDSENNTITYTISFIDGTLEPCLVYATDALVLSGQSTASGEQVDLGTLDVWYALNGYFDEHFADDLDRYSGELVTIQGESYKLIGEFLTANGRPHMVLQYTPYNNDVITYARLNPDDAVTFMDGSYEMVPTADANGVYTFEMTIQEDVWNEIVASVEDQWGSYFYLPLNFEFSDGCYAVDGGSILPIIYGIYRDDSEAPESSAPSSDPSSEPTSDPSSSENESNSGTSSDNGGSSNTSNQPTNVTGSSTPTAKDAKSPSTGDNTAMPFAAMGVLASVAGLVVLRRRKEQNDQR